MTFIPSFLSVSIRFPSGASTSSLTLLLVLRFRAALTGSTNHDCRYTTCGRVPNHSGNLYGAASTQARSEAWWSRLHSDDHVPGTIFDVVEIIGGLAHDFKNVLQHGDIVPLAIGADKIGFSQDTLGEDGPHGG